MDDSQVIQWNEFFLDRGLEADLAKKYTDYSKKLIRNNVPVVFELEHLSKLIGIEYKTLCRIINSSEHFYRTFKIKKKRGGDRTILAPYPSLLMCQEWLYKEILLKTPIHSCAIGYKPGYSLLDNARPHLGKKAILKIDIYNFFPSIPINWVISFFRSLGYSKSVSAYLALICCLDGKLPQGAATSPYLSNILLRHLDSRLKVLATLYGFEYTRYSDDITFSGSYIPHGFVRIVTDIVVDFGLRPNEEKTLLIVGNKKKIVTGILVSGEVMKIPRETRRELRKDIHFIKTYGLLSHVGKKKIRNPHYVDSLIGKLLFWLQVEPENSFARESLAYLRSLLRD